MSRKRVQRQHLMASAEVPPRPTDDDPIEALIRRAKRLLRKGEIRAALVMLRRACSMDDWRARSFTLLGALLRDAGRIDDAERAFLHARWLRQRAGEVSRAKVTMQLIDRLRLPRNVP